MKANDAERLKELEAEIARLKELVANMAFDMDMLREIASGDWSPRTASAAPSRCCVPGSGVRMTSLQRGRHPLPHVAAHPANGHHRESRVARLVAQAFGRSSPLRIASGGDNGPQGRLEGQRQADPMSAARRRPLSPATPREEASHRYRPPGRGDVPDPT